MIEFQLLGPLEVRVDGAPVALGGPRQKALLAVLLLDANRVISRDALLERLGGSPHALANRISRLRKALPEDRLLTTEVGYGIRVEPGELDLEAFEQACAEARNGEPAQVLRRAERLWRGPALADVDLPAAVEAQRLNELRVTAIEDRVEAELASGRHAELAAELEALVAEHPARERLHGQLMVARYRCGRQADALAAYRGARRVLVEQAGIEPGPELRRLHDAILHQDPRLDGAAVCPYKGLASYASEDAAYFCGRERVVDALIARLAAAPLLAVVGPSGSGKSSLLRAGLLPALARGALPGSAGWTVAVVRPGEPLPPVDLLVVDQFEEVFAQTDPGAYIATLRERRVAIAMRADFYGHCAAFPELVREHVLIGPLTGEDLRCAIEEPARRADLDVEPALVDALLADLDGRAGAMPLLSTALLELWRERDGRRLTLAAYLRSGGVQGAVARLAERAYLDLDGEQRELARRVLLSLAAEDAGGALVRRRAPLRAVPAELAARLADQRLLTIDGGTVELAHEALLSEWPRLRAWLEEDAQGRRLQRRLAESARAWEADGRDPAGLYRGGRLAAALEWATEHELADGERAFLERSRKAAERAQRRMRLALTGAVALLVALLVAGAAALDQRHAARAEATTAAAERLGAQALAADELDRALLLARQGVALENSPQTRSNLFAALLKSPAVIGQIHNGGTPLTSLALSPDGRTLALLDAESRLRLVDVRARHTVAGPVVITGVVTRSTSSGQPIPAEGNYLAFSDDGTLLAVAGNVPVVLDARTLRTRTQLGATYRLAYGLHFADHTLWLTLGGPLDVLNSVQPFDLRSGRQISAERVLLRGAGVMSMLAAGPQRVVVVASTAGGSVRDARTLRPLRRLPVRATAAAVSADGRMLLAGDHDGSVRFVDLGDGSVRLGAERHDGAVQRALISRDGRTAVTAGHDNRLIVWDMARAGAREVLSGHTGQITGVALSPDGRTLFSGAQDGKVLIWDLDGSRRLGGPFAVGRVNDSPVQHTQLVEHPLVSAALSADGTTLAVGQADGRVLLVDALELRALSSFRAFRGPVRSLTYVPHSGLLAVGGDGGALVIADPRSGRRVAALPGHQGTVLTPSFSADGTLMASVAPGTRVLLQPLRGGRPAGPTRAYDPLTGLTGPTDASLSPDGRTLAVTSVLGVDLVDVATLRKRGSLRDADTVRSLARFTPDGRFIVAGSSEGWARLWSARTLAPVTPKLGRRAGDVQWTSTSPDGRTLATGTVDGVVRLFDLPTRRAVGTPLPGVPNRPAAPLFTPDGAHLLVVTNGGRAYRWDVRPVAWTSKACAVAGRPLTRVEWSESLGDRPYRPACSPRAP